MKVLAFEQSYKQFTVEELMKLLRNERIRSSHLENFNKQLQVENAILDQTLKRIKQLLAELQEGL